MTVDELVAMLLEHPGHWPVAIQVTSREFDGLNGGWHEREHRSEVITMEVVADGRPPGFETPTVVLA